MTADEASWTARLATVPRTLGTAALLTAILPVDLAVTAVALAHRALVGAPPRAVAAEPRTVLVSGGKMTKALVLARAFHAAGHRVVLVDSAPNRLTGHRFSRAVSAFHVIPEPSDPGYTDALVDVVRREGVDVYVPVCAPASSRADALAKPALERHCTVLHGDAAFVDVVDDKAAFAARARDLGLPVPDTHRVTSPQDVVDFDFAAGEPPYVLKSIPYDPVHRLDLTLLPGPDEAATAAHARTKPISPDRPWILQSFVGGREYCTHGTVRDGRLQVFTCCESSAFQINYAHVEKPEIEAWVRAFCDERGVDGQYSFDFLETDDGRLVAIECNPRTHSAITLFAGHPDLARAHLDGLAEGEATLRPDPAARPTYWIHHELFRLLTGPDRRARLATILAGRDAIFALDDPVPFLATHHLHVPWLLARNLARLGRWVRVDLNIGKLVEPAGA